MKDTREHILDTALTLFLQKSYKGVTMKDIVESTGLSKGAFYHYFESKEKLFEEVINSFLTSFTVFENSDYSTYTLAEFYRHMSTVTNDFQKKLVEKNSNPHNTMFTANFYFMLFDGMILLPGLKEKMLRYQKKELSTWTSVITRAKKTGEIKSPMPDNQIAKIFISTADGVLLGIIIGSQFDTLKKELVSLWHSFYESLKA